MNDVKISNPSLSAIEYRTIEYRTSEYRLIEHLNSEQGVFKEYRILNNEQGISNDEGFIIKFLTTSS